MLDRTLAIAACLILLTLVALAEGPVAPLQGQVFAEGKPLPDATVVLLNESGEPAHIKIDLPTEPRYVSSSATDVSGSFVFFNVPKGKLNLQISKPGFLRRDQYVEFDGSPQNVHIELARGTMSPGKYPPAAGQTESIFYVTDRMPSGSGDPEKFFSNTRSSDGMHYGTAVVSVPSVRLIRTLSQEDLSTLNGDRVFNVVLVSVKEEPRSAFFPQLAVEGHGKDALVFIHGYSNSFDYAARRLGALKHDLNFSGPAILYSWASRNSLADYSDDEATAEWSSAHFQQFLHDLFQTGIREVHIIAHSMGNRVLLRGLEACNLQRVGEVVFAAPDVDADTFREVMPVVSKFADRMTEYANDKDRALQLSAIKHGLPRAGQLKAAIHNSDEDVVDATRVDTSLEHHSYFVDSPQVVADLALVLTGQMPPRPRLIQAQQGPIKYWQLQP